MDRWLYFRYSFRHIPRHYRLYALYIAYINSFNATTMTPEQTIKELQSIILGIEHDNYTVENIQKLIKKIKCKHVFKVKPTERYLKCMLCSYKQQ